VALIARGYRQRLFHCASGSFSARIDSEAFLISRSGLDRGQPHVDDLVPVVNGCCPAGTCPSTFARLHQAIYRRHPEVGAIINAAPIHATAFSAAATTLDTRTLPESYLLLRQPEKISFDLPLLSPAAAAEQVSLADAPRPAVLVRNAGVLVVGKNPLDAFDRLEVLEATAEAILGGRVLGESFSIPDQGIEELIRAFGG
jgi:L-fuculose-phosphate aldolase